MDASILKKALPRGILIGLTIAAIAFVSRLLLCGGSFFDHLFTLYGVRALIGVPAAWVVYFYKEEKKAAG